ncbi:bucentaur or craniofacial development-domain-containing protein [Xylaria telfairii]|nr:bucentaur or craniofacial development-domain-containing protein [Xylaria telfairii]
MSTEPMIDEDYAYASEDDSDFAPGAAPAEDGSESESESGAADDKPTSATPKRKEINGDAAEGDLENSGDETIIQKGRKRQKKAKRCDGDAEEEGGEGGLIKTRRQRALEKAERKSHAVTGPVTVNVDDLWTRMIAAPLIPPRNDARQDKENRQPGHGGADMTAEATKTAPANSNDIDTPGMIKIKRTYNFAGKVHTEEKLVARDSAEAKLYLASQDPNLASASAEDEQPRRKPRKAFRSIFEPVVEGLTERADLKLGMNIRLKLREQQAKAKKLNVVEKSRMDWAGFVDKEGIKDELEMAGKSKESYVSRQDFLHRVEANKEEEARRVRMAGRG